ncbi:MAG: MucR family transcriptional regulator [Pseudomonadota bacterium]
MSHTAEHTLKTELTAEIVSAFVSKNPIAADQISDVIRNVFGALDGVSTEAAQPEPVASEPAVPIKKSIKKDHLLCLECGRPFKSLKRHLMTAYGLTPDAYREKWGLKPDYPMVAPSYSEVRSKISLDAGLGKKG